MLAAPGGSLIMGWAGALLPKCLLSTRVACHSPSQSPVSPFGASAGSLLPPGPPGRHLSQPPLPPGHLLCLPGLRSASGQVPHTRGSGSRVSWPLLGQPRCQGTGRHPLCKAASHHSPIWTRHGPRLGGRVSMLLAHCNCPAGPQTRRHLCQASGAQGPLPSLSSSALGQSCLVSPFAGTACQRETTVSLGPRGRPPKGLRMRIQTTRKEPPSRTGRTRHVKPGQTLNLEWRGG